MTKPQCAGGTNDLVTLDFNPGGSDQKTESTEGTIHIPEEVQPETPWAASSQK